MNCIKEHIVKELNSMEVQQVSGAGAFSDAGLTLGQSIGAIVDASINNGSHVGASIGASMGQSIGAIVDGALDFLARLFGR